MNSTIEENYLKALFNLSGDNGEVNVSDLSKRLKIKMPTVTSMMKKLAEKKLVHYQSYKPLRLTAKGRREAGLIIRKHRLTEMFLSKIMGFGWEKVHEIAEHIEHIQSIEFFDRMDVLLGFPQVDPHGKPIPDKNGKVEKKHYIRLSDCVENNIVRLVAVDGSSEEFLKFLNSRQMKLGLKINVRAVEEFDKTMLVSYGKRYNEHLSFEVCQRLLVEKFNTH